MNASPPFMAFSSPTTRSSLRSSVTQHRPSLTGLMRREWYLAFRSLAITAALLLTVLPSFVTGVCPRGFVDGGAECVPDTTNRWNMFTVRVDQKLYSEESALVAQAGDAQLTLYRTCTQMGGTVVRIFDAERQESLLSRMAWYPEVAASSQHVVVGGVGHGNWTWLNEAEDGVSMLWRDTDRFYEQATFSSHVFTDPPYGFAYNARPERFVMFDPSPPPNRSLPYPTVFPAAEPNAVTNSTTSAQPTRLQVDVNSGYWHNSPLLYSPLYMACQRAEVHEQAVVAITRASLRSGANPRYGGNWDAVCAAQAGDGKQRAARLTSLMKDIGFRTAVSQNTAVPLLAAGMFLDSRWAWLSETDSTFANGKTFTENFAYPDTKLANLMFSMWAPSYPKNDPSATYLTYSATAGGWVNTALPATFDIACEPTTTASDTTGLTVVTLPPGWKQTAENMALMCYRGGAQRRLMQPTTPAKEAALEYLLATHSGADAGTIGVFGLVYLDNQWHWAGSPQYYPGGATPMTGAFTNWADGYAQADVSNGAVAGFSAAAGGWVAVNPGSTANWVAVCEPVPDDEPADATDNMYTAAAAATQLTRAATSAKIGATHALSDLSTSLEPCTKESSCSAGFSNDPANPGTCFKARCLVPHCDTCTSGYQTRCGTCSPGYSLDKFTGTCMKPTCQVTGCKSCEVGNTFVCEECASGFHLDAATKRCTVPVCHVVNCLSCTADSLDVCSTCTDGYVVNSSTGQCVEPPCTVDHCDTCILGDVTRCYRCGEGYALDGMQTCSVCASRFKMNSVGVCAPSGLETAALVGIIVGVVGGVVIIATTLFFLWLLCWRKDEPVTYVMTATPEPSILGEACVSPAGSTATAPAPILVDEELSSSATTKRRSSGQKLGKTRGSNAASDGPAFPPLELDLDAVAALQAFFRDPTSAPGPRAKPPPPVMKRRTSRERVSHFTDQDDTPHRAPVVPADPAVMDLPAAPDSDMQMSAPLHGASHPPDASAENVIEMDAEPVNDPTPPVKVVKRRQHRKNQ